MKYIFSTFLIFVFLGVNAQNVRLKKKWLKHYEGKIPSYEVNLNNEIYKIDATQIEISLTKDSLYVKVGSAIWSGTYLASKTAKKKYEIIGKMQGSGIPEVLYLEAREKKLTRKGLFPQPNAILTIHKK